jgi:hypothetical protein
MEIVILSIMPGEYDVFDAYADPEYVRSAILGARYDYNRAADKTEESSSTSISGYTELKFSQACCTRERLYELE